MGEPAVSTKKNDYGHATRLKLIEESEIDETKYVVRPGFLNLRRCQAKSKKNNGGQCRKIARRGSDFCDSHPRGRKSLKKNTKSANKRGAFANIMYVEGKSQKLKEALKAAKKEGAELLRLDDEIQVTRMLADKALNLFDKTIVDPPEGVTVSAEMRVAVMNNLRNSIKEVAVISEKAANIYAKSDYTLSAYQVDTLLNAVYKVVIKHLGEDQQGLCSTILEDIKNEGVNLIEKDDDTPKVKGDLQVSFESSTPIIDVTPD